MSAKHFVFIALFLIVPVSISLAKERDEAVAGGPDLDEAEQLLQSDEEDAARLRAVGGRQPFSALRLSFTDREFHKALTTIKEVVDSLKKGARVLNYADAVLDALEKDEDPPVREPDILGGKTLLEAFKGSIARLQDLKLPPETSTEAPPFPTLEQIAAGSIIESRAALHQAVEHTAGRVRQYGLLKQQTEMLREVIAMADTTIASARSLAEAFAEVYQAIPLTSIGELFGFAYLDLDQVFVPKVAELRRVAVKKEKEFSSALELRKQGFSNLVFNLKTLLDMEKKRIEAEEAGLKEEIEKLKREAQEAYDAWMAAFPDLQAEADSLGEERAALSRLADELRAEEQKLCAEIQSHNAQVEALKQSFAAQNAVGDALRGRRYSGCPNGHPFETCEHDDLKAEWVRRLNSDIDAHNLRMAELNVRNSNLTKARSELLAHRDSFSRRCDDFEQRRIKLDARSSAFEDKNQTHSDDFSAIRSKLKPVSDKERHLEFLAQAKTLNHADWFYLDERSID